MIYVDALHDVVHETIGISRSARSMRVNMNIDLRDKMPPVYDQGQLGSCSGNAIAAAYEFEMLRQGEPSYIPSRLFVYFNERVLENTVTTDSGAMIHDGIKTIEQYGVCPEQLWPYNTTLFAVKPSDEAYSAALRHKAITCNPVAVDLLDIQRVLSSGFPVIAGITLFPEFECAEVARTGVVPMPSGKLHAIGGHAVLIVGVDDNKQQLIMRNSWGDQWGDSGYFYISYDYIQPQLMCDLWSINVII